MLTPAEHALLLRSCKDHLAARCARCGGSFRMYELAADVFGHQCPACQLDLTHSLREHLIACVVAADLDAQNVLAEAKVLIETTVWLRKEARRLRDAAGVARAEAEAAVRHAYEKDHKPSAPQT